MSVLQNPSWFGRYRLTSRLATGGMAEVYVGRRVEPDGKPGPMVAVKRLLPHLSKDPNVVRMFLNEARITAQIHHPNVVRILDLGSENGEPFIAMELLDGKTFAELRQKVAEEGRRVPLGVTLRILVDACRGLHAAHRAVDTEGRELRIVHRDFTPENIHVGVMGEVKVIDFGIAKAPALNAGTEPGTLKGKFFYMSPEMIAGRAVDHRADIFAAGVMLYEQLCGRRPFTGTHGDEVLARISEGRPKPPRELDPSVPAALEAICLKALSTNPDERFENFEELTEAISGVGGAAQVATRAEVGAYVSSVFPDEVDPRRNLIKVSRQLDPSIPGANSISELSIPFDPPPAERPPEPTPSRRPWILAGAAVVGVLLLAGGVWLARSNGKTPAERIAAAKTAPSLDERIAELGPLAADARSTPEELDAAAKLLLDGTPTPAAAEAALAIADALRARGGSEAKAALYEGEAAVVLRFGKRAETALTKASELLPNDSTPDVLLADLKEKQGDLPGAVASLARALEKSPRQTELAMRQGYWLSQLGRLDEAARTLESVLERRFDARSAAELAFVRYRQEDAGGALKLLRRALAKEPKLAVAHYYLGAVLYRQGEVKAAEKAYREADRLEPTDARPLVALCQMQAQTQSKDLDATRKLIEQRFPQDAAKLLAGCS